MTSTSPREPGSTLLIQSTLLGPVTVAEAELFRFPQGLFGFAECRSFVLVPAQREGVFWLQSVERGELAFLLIDPFRFFLDLPLELGPADLSELEAPDASQVAILAIVTLPRSRQEQPTANLQGPVALNPHSRLGKQLALSEPGLGMSASFDLLSAPERS